MDEYRRPEYPRSDQPSPNRGTSRGLVVGIIIIALIIIGVLIWRYYPISPTSTDDSTTVTPTDEQDEDSVFPDFSINASPPSADETSATPSGGITIVPAF